MSEGEPYWLEVYRALHWREFELTVEDCRAYRTRNQYHFVFFSSPAIGSEQWKRIERELREWIWSPAMALILDIFGHGDDDDLMKVRCWLEDVMDGQASAPTAQARKGGAAMLRIEAGRRWFGSCFFHQAKTEAGLEALGAYHEKRDENRQIGLGPEHDWASHGADGFGLMCVVVESLFTKPKQEIRRPVRAASWMG